LLSPELSAVASVGAGTTNANARATAVTRSNPPTRSSPSQLISVPGGSSTETSSPSKCGTARWRSTVRVRSPHARRTSETRDPAGTITTSTSPSVASAAPIPDPLPNAPVQATITCHAPPSKTTRSSTDTTTGSGRPVAAARNAPIA